MPGGYLVAVLLCTAQALALAAVLPACAQDPVTPPAGQPATTRVPDAAKTAPQSSTDPVVAIIRAKLADPGIRKGANADDLAALEAFYKTRTGGPLWMTEMGFSAKGQSALFEIAKADDWGLAAVVFELPLAAELPASPEAEAIAEIKLDLAILKYARFARGGRLNPSEISDKLDQVPPLRDPKTILTEVEASDTPDTYLQLLHPKHEQFVRLRQALLKARGGGDEGEPASNTVAIERIVINMERWRWMPEDLGRVYVWNNSPEFMLYVVKDGKPIYADKTLVGTSAYATPVFTADMTMIVFNPDWVAPETVLTENLLPPLREQNYSILKIHKLSVSYNGKPVDPRAVDWSRVDIRAFTFTQKAGPDNVLGKVKFLFPNKHDVYLHDTLAYRKKYFQKPVRAIGHDCVRMEKPELFTDVLLAEDKGWPASQVKDLWDNAVNSPITLDHKIPVHMVYFTTVVDETGKVATFPDLYGFDRKLATVLFGNATGFPAPPPDTTVPREDGADASSSANRTATSHNDIAGSLQGFLGD
jgi:murein L,D-transpeptidase YcbB/YkuD